MINYGLSKNFISPKIVVNLGLTLDERKKPNIIIALDKRIIFIV